MSTSISATTFYNIDPRNPVGFGDFPSVNVSSMEGYLVLMIIGKTGLSRMIAARANVIISFRD